MIIPTITAVAAISAVNSATRASQEVQSPNLNCEYSVRIDNDVFQCMTAEQYKDYENHPLSNTDILAVSVVCFGVICLIILLLKGYKY